MSVDGGSLLIRGGTVVDGTGAAVVRADVAVEHGRIVDVGPRLAAPAGATVIDAGGLTVAPGFIDLHTHCDFTLLGYPRAESMLRQGVTTLVTGNCGNTPFPVFPEHEDLLRQATAFVDDGMDWQWSTAAEFRGRLEALPLSLNVAMLVGHGAIRIAVMGFEQRAPNAAELQRMQAEVDTAMEAGCVGLSSGLIYSPGTYAQTDELIALARVAAQHGGFYSTHMRNEGPNLLSSVEEALAVSTASGAPLQISHHKVLGKPNWGLVNRSLRRVHDMQAEGHDVLLDQYPYTATSTTLTALMPSWALSGGIEAMQTRLRDETTRAAVREEVLHGPADGRPKRDFEPDTVRIAGLHSERRHGYIGQSLATIGDAEHREPVDVFLDLMRDEGGGVEVVIFAMSEDDVRTVMRDPSVAVASDGWTLDPAAGGTPHPRSYGTFVRVLGRYARDGGVITLEEAVRKMTSLPAKRLAIPDRGVISRGAVADIVLFDAASVIDEATYEEPHRFARGVQHVIVNGTRVIRDGADTGAPTGSVLRGVGRGARA